MGREIAMQRQTRRERGRDKKISTVEKNAIVRLARRQKKQIKVSMRKPASLMDPNWTVSAKACK